MIRRIEDKIRRSTQVAFAANEPIVLEPDQPLPTAGSGGHLEIFRPKRGSSDLFRAYHVLVDGDDIGEVRRGG